MSLDQIGAATKGSMTGFLTDATVGAARGTLSSIFAGVVPVRRQTASTNCSAVRRLARGPR